MAGDTGSRAKGGGMSLPSESSLPHFSPVCSYCVHWKPADGRRCAAYPKANSIPVAIWSGRNLHMRYLAGDHHIRFDPVPGAKLPANLAAGMKAREAGKADEAAEE